MRIALPLQPAGCQAQAPLAPLAPPRGCITQVPLRGWQWEVACACGSLKGGRSDWLVEKAAELGAASLTPLLTQRSPSIGSGGDDERPAAQGGKRAGRRRGGQSVGRGVCRLGRSWRAKALQG